MTPADEADTASGSDDQLSLERQAMVEEVLKAVGNQKRLATLEQLTQGTPASRIHEQVGASRSGVNRFLQDFREAELVERVEGAEAGQAARYRLTEKGGVVVRALNELDAAFEEFERERIRETIASANISREELESLLDEMEQ